MNLKQLSNDSLNQTLKSLVQKEKIISQYLEPRTFSIFAAKTEDEIRETNKKITADLIRK